MLLRLKSRKGLVREGALFDVDGAGASAEADEEVLKYRAAVARAVRVVDARLILVDIFAVRYR